MAELPTPTQKTVPSDDIRDHVYAGGMLDKVVTSTDLTYTDRLGGEHYTVDGIKAEGDKVVEETRQNLIPLSRQYMTLEDAQADIANIPEGASTYVRSADDKSLAYEYLNISGVLTATGRKMPSQEYINSLIETINSSDEDSPYLTLAGKNGFSWSLLRNSGLYWRAIALNQQELRNEVIDIKNNLLRAGGIEMSQFSGDKLVLVGKHGFSKEVALSGFTPVENVESDALEHWVFGVSNDSLLGLNGRHNLTPQGINHAFSKNFVTIPAWGGALLSDIQDSLEYTRCAVVRYDGVKGVSVFNNADYALSIGGGRFIITNETKTGDALKVVCVEKGLDTQGWYIPAAIGDWIFIALTERLSDTGASCTRSIFIGGQVPLDIREPDNKTRDLATYPVAIGNAWSDNANYKTNQLVIAESIIYSVALSPTEIQSLYERRKQAMAARGIKIY
ncbi:hypothetical protein ACXKL1_001008 [Klebsiella oxytoca]